MTTTDKVFGLCVCQKWIYQPENWHARCPGMVIQNILRILKILDFAKSNIKISVFLTFRVKKSCFGKSEVVIFKNSIFYVFWCFLFAFCVKIAVFGDFQTLINFRPKMA